MNHIAQLAAETKQAQNRRLPAPPTPTNDGHPHCGIDVIPRSPHYLIFGWIHIHSMDSFHGTTPTRCGVFRATRQLFKLGERIWEEPPNQARKQAPYRTVISTVLVVATRRISTVPVIVYRQNERPSRMPRSNTSVFGPIRSEQHPICPVDLLLQLREC